MCGMKDPLNVLEVEKLLPDYLGFIFYPGSPRYVGEEPDISLFENVRSGILKVGVFVNESPDKVTDIALKSGLDIIQLHGYESTEYCSKIRSEGLSIIKTFLVDNEIDFEMIKPYDKSCDYFLFDTKTEVFGGSGKKFRWECLKSYNLDKPFFLSGGLEPGDSEIIGDIKNRGFYAVDVNSRFETDPGIKNTSLLRTFIETVKYY